MIFENVPNEFKVYGTLFALTNRIQTIGDEVFSDISIKQHFILMTIGLFYDKNPSLTEVAYIAGCSYQNIKKLATILETKGYLKIERDTIDKRKYNLIKTEKVKEFSANMDIEIKLFIKSLYKDVTQKQLFNMFNVLEQMNKNLKALQKGQTQNE